MSQSLDMSIVTLYYLVYHPIYLYEHYNHYIIYYIHWEFLFSTIPYINNGIVVHHPTHNSILKSRSQYIILYLIGGRQAYFLQMNHFISLVMNYISQHPTSIKYVIIQHRFRPKSLSKRTGISLSKRNLPGKQFNDSLPNSISIPNSNSDWNLFSHNNIEKYTIWTDNPTTHINHITCDSLLLNAKKIYFLSNYLALPSYFNNHVDKFHLYVQHIPNNPNQEYNSKQILQHNSSSLLYTKHDYSVAFKSKHHHTIDNIDFKDYFK